MSFGQILLQWIDLIWLPIAFFMAAKPIRFKALGYIVCCFIALRLQTELLEEFNRPYGLLPFMGSYVFYRGLLIYSVFNVLYLALAHYYRRFDPFIFLAASLSLLGIAVMVSSFVMLL